MHPGWVDPVFTEGLDPGDTHPLPRTMEKAFLGDFVGAGVNWWAKIGKVDDIGPEDLLQNLESVLTKGNDSTKGLTLGCADLVKVMILIQLQLRLCWLMKAQPRLLAI